MKVLIAVADKVFGDALVGFVRNHKWPEHTAFRILHVVEHGPGDATKATFDKGFQEDCAESRHLVDHMSASLHREFPDVKIDAIVVIGSATKIIMDSAAEWQADMIVMGSHGRKGLDRLLLGSVAEYVTAHAPCSVSIIRPEYPDELPVELSSEDLPDQVRELAAFE